MNAAETFLPKNGSLWRVRLPSNAVVDRVHDVAGDMQCQLK